MVPFGSFGYASLIVGNNPKKDVRHRIVTGLITFADYLDRVSYSREKGISRKGRKNPITAFSDVLKNKHAVLLLIVS